jgi:hypothetical protein
VSATTTDIRPIDKGANWSIVLRWKDDTGTWVDFTGKTTTFTFYREGLSVVAATVALHSLDSTKLDVSLTYTQTGALTEGIYTAYWDVDHFRPLVAVIEVRA